MFTVRPGAQEAVLFPMTAVALSRATSVSIVVLAAAGVTVAMPVLTIVSGLYVTDEEMDSPAPVKTVDAPDTTQPAVPPRLSVTEVAPREPAIAETATEVLVPVRAAEGGTDRIKLPPVRVNVAVVVPAEAGRAVPARRAAVAMAMRTCWRRLMELPPVAGRVAGRLSHYQWLRPPVFTGEAVLQALFVASELCAAWDTARFATGIR
jgi:hypothetical protein